MVITMKIDIASDFSLKPFGRDENDGKFSGKRFRDEKLIPAFRDSQESIDVFLDNVKRGYGSSFLEEAFAGLLRNEITYLEVKNRLNIVTTNEGYMEEIWEYIEEQKERNEHNCESA